VPTVAEDDFVCVSNEPSVLLCGTVHVCWIYGWILVKFDRYFYYSWTVVGYIGYYWSSWLYSWLSKKSWSFGWILGVG